MFTNLGQAIQTNVTTYVDSNDCNFFELFGGKILRKLTRNLLNHANLDKRRLVTLKSLFTD